MLLLSHLTHATSHPDPHLPNLAGVLPDTELDDLSKLAMISEAADSISEAADSADGGCGTGPAGLYSPPGTNASTWRLRVVGSGDRVRDRAECAPDDWSGAPALYTFNVPRYFATNLRAREFAKQKNFHARNGRLVWHIKYQAKVRMRRDEMKRIRRRGGG